MSWAGCSRSSHWLVRRPWAWRTSGRARHLVADVDDTRAEGAGLEKLEIHSALAVGKEWNATANQHRVDPGPVLVDQIHPGCFGGERGAADRDVAVPGFVPQPPDLLRKAPGSQPGTTLHCRQRGGEHHLWERLPRRGPLARRKAERWILINRFPVQHGLVQPSSQQVDADLAHLVGDETKDLLVGHGPIEFAIRPDEEVFRLVTDEMREISIHLLGRRK